MKQFTQTSFYKKYSSQLSAVFALLILIIALSILSDKFLTSGNLVSILNQIAYLSIMAIGITGVTMTGCFDLSVAATLALTVSVAGELVVKHGVPEVLFIPIVLAISLACGATAATGITKLDISPFVVTLALMNIYRGLASIVTGGFSAQGMPSAVKFLGSGKLFNVIPVSIVLMLVLYVIEWFILTKTSIGMQMRSVGGNPVAANLSGINVKKVKYFAYMQNSLLAGIAGIVLVGRMNSANSTLATGVEMDAIAAVVIGGTSLSGGLGNIWGTLIGAVVMGVLRNGLNLLQITAFWQQVAIGVLVFLACAIDAIRIKRAKNTIG